MQTIREALESWLEAGGNRIGEVAIRRTKTGFVLTHWEEADASSVPPPERFTRPEDARSIAWLDASGRYRPLKSAPNLRRGWRLELESLDTLCLALDFFYPVALGIGFAFANGRLQTVPLRETLARQSGMYAVTRKATDAAIHAAAGQCCASRGGCLKTILWEVAPGQPLAVFPPGKFDPAADQLASEQSDKAFPLLCHEACNLLVAAIRKTVKDPQ